MKLVADANVLLSAVIGGRARHVLHHPKVEQVVTAAVTFAEVQEYALQLGKRRQMSQEILQLTIAALPITIVPQGTYSGSLRKARQLVGRRDPDDIDLLALALHTGYLLWSNDNDFEDCGVPWLTTAELLARLGAPD